MRGRSVNANWPGRMLMHLCQNWPVSSPDTLRLDMPVTPKINA
jgi:hypothetical protein